MKLNSLVLCFFIGAALQAEIPLFRVLRDREVFSSRLLNTVFVPDGPIITQYRSLVNQHCAEVIRTAKLQQGTVGVMGRYALLNTLKEPVRTDKWEARKDVLVQLGEVSKQIHAEADIENEEYDRLKNAFLFKTTGVLVDLVMSETVSILDMLDESYCYWVNQQAKPWHYFFHKSPHKWVLGKNQEEEVRAKIKYLTTYRKKYYTFLGRLVQYICMLDGEISTQQEILSANPRVWIRGLLNIIREMVLSIPRRDKDGSDFLLLIHDMQNAIGRADKVKLLLKEDIIKHAAQKSSHLERNWLWYVGAAGAVYWGITNYQQNGVVKSIISPEKPIDLDALFKTHFKSPINKITKAVSGKPWFVDSNEPDLPLINERLGAQMRREFDFNNPQLVAEAVVAFERDALDWMPRGSDRTGIKTWLAQMATTLMFRFLGKAMPDLVDRIEDKHLIRALKKLDDLLESNSVVLGMAGLVPVATLIGGTAYGIRGLYRKVTHKDYTPMKMALCDIEELLIRMNIDQFNEELYGELLHKLHVLRAKAQHLVPQEHGVRMQFMKQLYYLESMQFSSEDKRSFIQNMRERYEFLRA